MFRALFIISAIVLVSACETTRQSQTGNIGTSSQALPEHSFNKSEAAEKRAGFGLTYINNGNYQRAKFHLDKALDYNPDSGLVNYALGIYFQRVKELDQAEVHFKRALSIDKKRPEFLNAYGAYLCEKGKYKEASNMFERAIDIPTYSDISSAFFNIGFCALKQNDVEKASDYFRKALNRDRRRPDALIEMSKIEFNKKRYSRAIDYLRRFEQEGRMTSESAWIGLRAAHYLRDKDAIAKYGLILERRFPDSEETVTYLDNKKQWM